MFYNHNFYNSDWYTSYLIIVILKLVSLLFYQNHYNIVCRAYTYNGLLYSCIDVMLIAYILYCQIFLYFLLALPDIPVFCNNETCILPLLFTVKLPSFNSTVGLGSIKKSIIVMSLHMRIILMIVKMVAV